MNLQLGINYWNTRFCLIWHQLLCLFKSWTGKQKVNKSITDQKCRPINTFDFCFIKFNGVNSGKIFHNCIIKVVFKSFLYLKGVYYLIEFNKTCLQINHNFFYVFCKCFIDVNSVIRILSLINRIHDNNFNGNLISLP